MTRDRVAELLWTGVRLGWISPPTPSNATSGAILSSVAKPLMATTAGYTCAKPGDNSLPTQHLALVPFGN